MAALVALAFLVSVLLVTGTGGQPQGLGLDVDLLEGVLSGEDGLRVLIGQLPEVGQGSLSHLDELLDLVLEVLGWLEYSNVVELLLDVRDHELLEEPRDRFCVGLGVFAEFGEGRLHRRGRARPHPPRRWRSPPARNSALVSRLLSLSSPQAGSARPAAETTTATDALTGGAPRSPDQSGRAFGGW